MQTPCNVEDHAGPYTILEVGPQNHTRDSLVGPKPNHHGGVYGPSGRQVWLILELTAPGTQKGWPLPGDESNKKIFLRLQSGLFEDPPPITTLNAAPRTKNIAYTAGATETTPSLGFKRPYTLKPLKKILVNRVLLSPIRENIKYPKGPKAYLA